MSFLRFLHLQNMWWSLGLIHCRTSRANDSTLSYIAVLHIHNHDRVHSSHDKDTASFPQKARCGDWPSFMRSQYSFKLIDSSPDLDVWKRRRSAIFARLVESSWMPSFKFFPNCS